MIMVTARLIRLKTGQIELWIGLKGIRGFSLIRKILFKSTLWAFAVAEKCHVF